MLLGSCQRQDHRKLLMLSLSLTWSPRWEKDWISTAERKVVPDSYSPVCHLNLSKFVVIAYSSGTSSTGKSQCLAPISCSVVTRHVLLLKKQFRLPVPSQLFLLPCFLQPACLNLIPIPLLWPRQPHWMTLVVPPMVKIIPHGSPTSHPASDASQSCPSPVSDQWLRTSLCPKTRSLVNKFSRFQCSYSSTFDVICITVTMADWFCLW